MIFPKRPKASGIGALPQDGGERKIPWKFMGWPWGHIQPLSPNLLLSSQVDSSSEVSVGS
jgi:hypothetical protein